jgi:hypothetical protein
MEKEKQNPKMMKKGKKTPKSKNFACPGSYFGRLANRGLYEVRLAKTGLNFEIPHSKLMRFMWGRRFLKTLMRLIGSLLSHNEQMER